MDNYPEHDKLSLVSDKSQTIGEFLAWLEAGGLGTEYGSVELAFFPLHRGGLAPLMKPKTELLAKFFDIDLDKIEDEKQVMIAEIRASEEEAA